MSKFVIDIKAIDDRLVIVDARNDIELYEIEVNDYENCEADRLIDKLDEGISTVMRYRENVMIARKEKEAIEFAAKEAAEQKTDEIVIESSIDYFKAISKLMADYSPVFNMDTDIAMKAIIDMAIQFNVDSIELGKVVYTYMEERRKILEANALPMLIDNITKNYPR